MRVTMYGTRGSCPVSNPNSIRYGGNTTSVRIESQCLPAKTVLAVDAGSGFLPLSEQTFRECPNMALLFTHYHHDHTQGFPLAVHTYLPHATIRVWGPVEHKEGPLEQLRRIMEPPQFPVSLEKVQHRMKFIRLDYVSTEVLVVHPVSGFALMKLHVFEEADKESKQVTIGKERHSIDECLVIKMYKTVHPEYTVSYRFEERPTGKVFVFLTDHENTASLPQDLIRHLWRADVLVQDAQYSQHVYETQTAGWGHGTPEYCIETAARAEVKLLGLTHHDPKATDEEVDARVNDARLHGIQIGAEGLSKTVFGCRDYMTFEV